MTLPSPRTGVRPLSGLVGAALLLAALPAAALAQTAQIDTRAGSTFSTLAGVGHFTSVTNNQRVFDPMAAGQTFRAPTNGATVLESFSFFLNDDISNPGSPITTFRAFLAEWDAAVNRPTGEILWRSEARQGSDLPYRDAQGRLQFEEYRFATGGVTLNPGQLYLAFLSTGDDLAAPLGNSVYYFTAIQLANDDPSPAAGYADGSHVLLTHQGLTGGPLTGATLRNATVSVYNGWDAGFTASFGAPAPVADMPEPASLAMVVAGLAAVGRATRRRRERHA